MTTKHDKVFRCPTTGQPDSAPWTPEQAAEHGRATYKDRAGCSICGTDHPKMRYVIGNDCVGCSTERAHELFKYWCEGMPGRPDIFPTSDVQAVELGVDWYFNHPSHPLVCTGGQHFRRTALSGGACRECELIREQQRAVERGPRASARRAGMTTYIPTEPCAECDTLAQRNVVTNACYGCAEKRRAGRPRGSRALARAAGEIRYAPDFDCPRCGTRADRNVVTNACSGCSSTRRPPGSATPAPAVDRRRTPTTMMVEQYPDMTISRENARTFGFTQYRTGEPCRRGHTGWRYVSVGTCIPCARGER